jgi:uncharacterized protein (TIGR02271 family)
VEARKVTETDRVSELVDRNSEDADVERFPAADGDSGEIETLPDGSVSIPLFEERLVVTKELVVRERIIIRKRTTTEQQRIEADLRRERIEVAAPDELLEQPNQDAEPAADAAA